MVAVLAVVAGSVAGIIAIVGDTGKHLSEKYSSKPVKFYEEPPRHELTAAERREIRQVSLVFIGSAVARQHLDDSYDLVGPSLREGLTKAQWRTGNIPVIPFAVQSVAHWTLDYSYANDVAFEVVLLGKPGTHPHGKTFFIELKRFPRIHPGHWLVESWGPIGISSDTTVEPRRAAARTAPVGAPLSAKWLLIPAGILVLLFLVPVAIFSRHWYASRRARRALSRP
jgi:hypothetical protein